MSDEKIKSAHRAWTATGDASHFSAFEAERRRSGLMGEVEPSLAAAQAVLMAWPKLKRPAGALKAPGKITYDEAERVIRAYFTTRGWRPKIAVDETVGRVMNLPCMGVGCGHPAADHVVAEYRSLPTFCSSAGCQCNNYRPPYSVLPPGFPPNRDPNWNPIPTGALIAPEFDRWVAIGASGSRSAVFSMWSPAENTNGLWVRPTWGTIGRDDRWWLIDRNAQFGSGGMVDKKALADAMLQRSLRTERPLMPNPPKQVDDYWPRRPDGKVAPEKFTQEQVVAYASQGWERTQCRECLAFTSRRIGAPQDQPSFCSVDCAKKWYRRDRLAKQCDPDSLEGRHARAAALHYMPAELKDAKEAAAWSKAAKKGDTDTLLRIFEESERRMDKFLGKAPRKNPRGDERRRDLERRAAQGDPDAQRALEASRARVTDPWEIQAAEAASQIEFANGPDGFHRVLLPEVRRWRELFSEEKLANHLDQPPKGWAAFMQFPLGRTRSGRPSRARVSVQLGPYCAVPVGMNYLWVKPTQLVVDTVREAWGAPDNRDRLHFEIVPRISQDGSSPSTLLVTVRSGLIIASRWLAIIPLLEMPASVYPQPDPPEANPGRRSDPASLVGRSVRARRMIHQSPLSKAPDVPAGSVGSVEDYDSLAGLLFVDFGGRQGVVACLPSEIAPVPVRWYS